jgi:hemerythrin superfamily protein
MKRKTTKESAAKSTGFEPLVELKRAVKRVVKRAAARAAERTQNEEKSALRLLKTQHDEVKALFEGIEKARTRGAKTKLFDELAANLVAHDAIEREIFYPACEKKMGMTKLLGEALVEHGLVEFGLYQADQARKVEDFDFKVQVLSEVVLHHAKEEENDFFPQVEKSLSSAELTNLGAAMKARFEEAKASDFRGPLHRNLEQVLAGALEPSRARPRKGKAALHVERATKSSARPKAAKRRRAA